MSDYNALDIDFHNRLYSLRDIHHAFGSWSSRCPAETASEFCKGASVFCLKLMTTMG